MDNRPIGIFDSGLGGLSVGSVDLNQYIVGGTAPYTFLGTAEYVSHTGSKPMNVVWKLHKEIPAKYLRKVQQVMG